jgi:hypothetical protein
MARASLRRNFDRAVESLEQELRHEGAGTVGLAVVGFDERYLAVTPCLPDGVAADFVALPLGCLTKLITAALVLRASVLEPAGLEATADHWMRSARDCPVERDVTLRQLLNHTHGIDPSGLDAFIEEAYVDPEAFARRLGQAPRLAAPGELYCYGHFAFAALAAGLCEAQQRSFQSLAAEQLPLARCAEASNGPPDKPKFVCGSTGGCLAAHALDVAEFALKSAPSTGECGVRHRGRVPMRGWSPHEVGAELGWKFYRDGWVGHNSQSERGGIALRVEPERRFALVTWTRGISSASALQLAFGHAFPEMTSFAPIKESAAHPCDAAQITGTYSNAVLSIRCVYRGKSPEALTMEQRPDGATATLARIGPRRWIGSRDGQPVLAEFLFDARGDCNHLWTGKDMLRRT